MDIFDRLGTLIRSLVNEDADSDGRTGFTDPDMEAAWSELEGYINDGAATTHSGRRPPKPSVPDQIRRDFRNLEVPPGAPISEVKQAYKRLMAAYHPDRHSADPERMRAATEVTKRLNQSYNRIVDHYAAQPATRQTEG